MNKSEDKKMKEKIRVEIDKFCKILQKMAPEYKVYSSCCFVKKVTGGYENMCAIATSPGVALGDATFMHALVGHNIICTVVNDKK